MLCQEKRVFSFTVQSNTEPIHENTNNNPRKHRVYTRVHMKPHAARMHRYKLGPCAMQAFVASDRKLVYNRKKNTWVPAEAYSDTVLSYMRTSTRAFCGAMYYKYVHTNVPK
jgi:hypothetical protein